MSLSGSGREVGLGWGGRLLTFSAFRMGAYSRWALIRGWVLIRINTVVWYAREGPDRLGIPRHIDSFSRFAE